MQTTPVLIQDKNGNPIDGSRALIWGNNAAWLCIGCDQLLGNRTADGEFHVVCGCGRAYDSHREGDQNLARATGVQCA